VADAVALPLALVTLAAALAAAVIRPTYLAKAGAASAGALLLVAVGAIGLSQAGHAIRSSHRRSRSWRPCC